MINKGERERRDKTREKKVNGRHTLLPKLLLLAQVVLGTGCNELLRSSVDRISNK